LVALVGLPLANGAITAALTTARDLSPRLRTLLATIFGYTARLRRLDAGMGGLVLVPLLIGAAWAALHMPAAVARTNFPPDQFPAEAAHAIEALPADARILAPDKFGGYLIYRFAGSRKVFFDGRSDFYGSAFMKEYIRLVEVRPGWEEQLSRWRFTHALLPVQYSLIPALERLGWRRLYQDSTAVLLVRP
jgi:hypothetical protein